MTRMKIEIPTDVRWDEATAKQFIESAPYFIDKATIRAASVDGRSVMLDSAGDVAVDELQRNVESLARRIARNLRDARETMLVEYLPESVAIHPDPMLALAASGSLHQTGRGRFVYGRSLLELLEALDRFVYAYAIGIGAEPQAYPTTVDALTLIQSGYLKAFPQHALFVAPVACSAESLAEIGRCTSPNDLDAPRQATLFAPHDQVLAPTVCYHCMEVLKGREVTAPKSYTAVNQCHRFEVLSGASLDRLQTFRMREIVSFGDERYIIDVLDAALDWTTKVLRRWEIAHRALTATDPFFAGATSNKLYFQSIFSLKREIRVRLNFSGMWISVASFNNHQDSLSTAFRIRGSDGALRSGCVGWGFERFAYALLAQLGTDVSRWPRAARDDLGV